MPNEPKTFSSQDRKSKRTVTTHERAWLLSALINYSPSIVCHCVSKLSSLFKLTLIPGEPTSIKQLKSASNYTTVAVHVQRKIE